MPRVQPTPPGLLTPKELRDVHMPADITEMWWDVSHNWSIIMEGYRIFRKDRQWRRCVATLCVTDQMKHMELCLRSRR